jgi:mRNA interferase MazF
MKYLKYDIILINLNPTQGSEQQGIRPCIILQNNIANISGLQTITIAPLSSILKEYPSSVCIQKSSHNNLSSPSRIELSQIRTIDRKRIIKKIGSLEEKYHHELQEKLILFFDIYNIFTKK